MAGYRATQQRTEIGITHVWISLQPRRQCTLRMHSRWASFLSELGQTPSRGRRPKGVCLYGFARSVVLIVTTCIEMSYSESSYKKLNPSWYAPRGAVLIIRLGNVVCHRVLEVARVFSLFPWCWFLLKLVVLNVLPCVLFETRFHLDAEL